MQSRYDAFIFDMDGTILDSMRVWRGMWREYIEDHGLKTPAELAGKEYYFFGVAAGYIARDEGLDKEALVREIMDNYLARHYQTDIEPKPYAVETLWEMKKAGMPLALATATSMKYAMLALERLNLLPLFDFITDNERMGIGKSDPAYFVKAAEMMGSTPEKCLMFEDAVYSIRTAHQAGMPVCAVEDPMAAENKEEIMGLSRYYVRSWAELADQKWRDMLI